MMGLVVVICMEIIEIVFVDSISISIGRLVCRIDESDSQRNKIHEINV